MTMTSDTPNEITKQKPKRKQQRRKRAVRAAPAAKPEVPKEFEGLSPTDCCDACNVDRCVISGINVCGHPFKGGLRSEQMMQPDAVQRYRRAKRALGEAKLNLQQMTGG